MRKFLLAAALAALATAPAHATNESAIAAAIADPSRPQEDRDRDAARKPAELLAFSGVKGGDVVVDFLPGGGYFTRLFANVAGVKGKVYAWVSQGAPEEYVKAGQAAIEGRDNAEFVNDSPMGPVSFSGADIVWTSQNYHDLHTKNAAGLDIAVFNKVIFDSLKPGGAFIVIDHTAAAGSGLEVCETLHRIDPAIVKKEVEAAGFVLEEESALLDNPDDKLDLMVFDEKIRGKTDQFIFKFRKPAA